MVNIVEYLIHFNGMWRGDCVFSFLKKEVEGGEISFLILGLNNYKAKESHAV